MPEVDPTTPEVTEQAVVAATQPEETVKKPATEPEQPVEETPAETPTPQEPDYKEKFRQSSSEALILNAQVKQKDELLSKLTSQDAPSEQELLAEYPDYEGFDQNSKKFVIDLLTTKKRQARIDRQLAEQDADRRWNAELKSLTSQDKYQALKGDGKFEEFVLQPKHKGLDLSVLADAYLMRTGQTPVEDTPKEVQKQEVLPSGGAERRPAKKAKMSIEEAAVLRKTDYKRFLDLVKTGMIDDEL